MICKEINSIIRILGFILKKETIYFKFTKVISNNKVGVRNLYKKLPKIPAKKIPASLIYEVIDGNLSTLKLTEKY